MEEPIGRENGFKIQTKVKGAGFMPLTGDSRTPTGKVFGSSTRLAVALGALAPYAGVCTLGLQIAVGAFVLGPVPRARSSA